MDAERPVAVDSVAAVLGVRGGVERPELAEAVGVDLGAGAHDEFVERAVLGVGVAVGISSSFIN